MGMSMIYLCTKFHIPCSNDPSLYAIKLRCDTDYLWLSFCCFFNILLQNYINKRLHLLKICYTSSEPYIKWDLISPPLSKSHDSHVNNRKSKIEVLRPLLAWCPYQDSWKSVIWFKDITRKNKKMAKKCFFSG